MADTNPRLAIFDCDGTLVDSQHVIVRAMDDTFAVHGLGRPDPVQVRRVVGLSLDEAIGRLVPDADRQFLAALVTTYREAFYAIRTGGDYHEPMFPGAREVLAALEGAGFLIGMATGKSLRGARATMERHGIAEYFVTVQTADRCPGKPNPEMIRRALSETGTAPVNTVMIGDTTFDMEMARAAGVPAIGVAWGYHDVNELRDTGARAIADVFERIPDIAGDLVVER
jgi:phosphoglycolate phosphatase